MIVYSLVLHFVADFLLQSREMGKKKSSEFKWLAKHLAIQFSVIFIGLLFGLTCLVSQHDSEFFFWLFNYHDNIIIALKFAGWNAVIHGLIDWNIWNLYKLSAHKRIVKSANLKALTDPDWNIPYETRFKSHYDIQVKNWQYWEDHLFYTTIGFDQLLHASTLVILAGVLL